MARYRGADCRLCRREGIKLFLKGEKCTSQKCPLIKRDYAPGQHGMRKPKLSDYGLQLREKQKVKRIYGILERQFKRYFKIASKSKGITGSILLQLLERRLDNVIYSCGFATSRAQARQITRHGIVYVNGRRLNIPSYLIKKDDLIEIKEKKREMIKKNLELTKERSKPSWLEIDSENLKVKVLRLPERGDIQQQIQEQLIVELYSK